MSATPLPDRRPGSRPAIALALAVATVLTAVASTEPDGPTVADRIQRVRYRPGDPNWEVIDDDATATVLVATPSLGDDIAAVVAPPYAADDPIELLDRNGDLVSTATGRPANLEGHSNNALPIWTGREILFWSGRDFGWAVEPDTGRWRTFPAGNVASRVDGAAVWADGVMLTWGGFVSNQDGTATGGNDGIIYRPPD